MRLAMDVLPYMKVRLAYLASLDSCRLMGGGIFTVTCMRLAADITLHMKVWLAHLAYLNACRLMGGETFTVRFGKEIIVL